MIKEIGIQRADPGEGCRFIRRRAQGRPHRSPADRHLRTSHDTGTSLQDTEKNVYNFQHFRLNFCTVFEVKILI